MKIIGNKESVNQISLTHKGINARFNCFMKPFPYCNDIDTSNPEIIEIIFKDSYEIDNLIDVLEKFKKECFGHLGDLEMEDCDKARREWAESEYIEKSVIVISKKDRAFFEYLKEEFKYIVRDKDGTLFTYKDGLTNWFSLNRRFDVDFPMVKWEGNEEIWLIEDLKKLEVVEEYEENSKKNSK